MQSIPASRVRLRSSGKMPTTSVRRPTSRLNRSSGLVERSLRQCELGKGVEGEDAALGVLEHRRDLAHKPAARRPSAPAQSAAAAPKAREIAALTQLGNLQLDLARPRVPTPRPIAVALGRAI